MGRLDGKVALITGAARGQGEAEARHFVAEGARVAVSDVLEDEGRSLADELGDAAIFVPLDVTSEEEWKRAVDETLEQLGGLNALVNNAGILTFAPLTETTLEEYQRTVDINQVGVFLGMKTAVPPMAGGGGGAVVNVSSIEGQMGTQGAVAYCATKFAVRGMTKTAALELGPLGIRVNSIHPGFIETPMTARPEIQDALAALLPRIPQGRVGDASEVASLAAFLVSDESAYCTGAEFTIDGGLTAGPYMSLG